MQRLIRAALGAALVASLAACVVTPPPKRPAPRPRPVQPIPVQPPPPPPQPAPPPIGVERMNGILGRIDSLGNRIDSRVNGGAYPPPQGEALHRRLEVIRQEANDMSAQHGGGLTADEQRVLNQELDTARARDRRLRQAGRLARAASRHGPSAGGPARSNRRAAGSGLPRFPRLALSTHAGMARPPACAMRLRPPLVHRRTRLVQRLSRACPQLVHPLFHRLIHARCPACPRLVPALSRACPLIRPPACPQLHAALSPLDPQAVHRLVPRRHADADRRAARSAAGIRALPACRQAT